MCRCRSSCSSPVLAATTLFAPLSGHGTRDPDRDRGHPDDAGVPSGLGSVARASAWRSDTTGPPAPLFGALRFAVACAVCKILYLVFFSTSWTAHSIRLPWITRQDSTCVITQGPPPDTIDVGRVGAMTWHMRDPSRHTLQHSVQPRKDG